MTRKLTLLAWYRITFPRRVGATDVEMNRELHKFAVNCAADNQDDDASGGGKKRLRVMQTLHS